MTEQGPGARAAAGAYPSSLRSRLWQELRSRQPAGAGVVEPSQMAEAVCRVLDKPAAGIVVLHRLLRLPIGSTGAAADEAEQLQVTLGEGPCLGSARSGEPLCTTEEDLRQEWPLYHVGLVERTPFRSTVSLPLKRSGGRVFAALDLYDTEPAPLLAHPLGLVQDQVGELVAMLLLVMLDDPHHRTDWPPASVERRQRVWVAIGMMLEVSGLDDVAALAILQAYAFRRDLLLDEVAVELVEHGRLTPADILGDIAPRRP